MKTNNYIQPIVEVSDVIAYSVCQSTSYTQPTGAPIPGDPNEGR